MALRDRLKRIYHRCIPILADWYYGRPGKKMIVIGVTGTKGKSTTCRLIASVLEAGGYKVGLMSTVEFQIGDRRWLNDKKMSMLGRGKIQKMMKEMVKAGCGYALIETSSEGILQNRHLGVHYDIAVFTNLGTEHSERHGGFEKLKSDKGKLFSGLAKEKNKILRGGKIDKVIVTNAEDPHASYFASFPADKKYHFDLEGKNIVATAAGTDFMAMGHKFHLNILGEFNVSNALAALAVGKSQNISVEKMAEGLADVKMLDGRMEFIEEGQNFKVVVDYAHEPLSLEALFKSLRAIINSDKKVIGVIGSDGGGRDTNKRTKMGEIASRLCDYVVITDVNCFDEDPRQIVEMLATGARVAGKKDGENLFIEIDRRTGIKKAISLAKAGDIVAITAKGTEPVMCVAHGKRLPWDDRQVTREILQAL